MTQKSLAVGLVGAGPWAKMVHAPMLAAGPETTLAGVWARDFAKASDLAGRNGAHAFERYEDLLDACEAVAFAVAPGAQPQFAIAAARAGKALLLEKPLAADVAGAEAIVEAVEASGVRSMLMLSYRFSPPVEEFIVAARASNPIGGRATFLHGGFLEGPFAFGWRLERGALLDLGPHVADLACAVFGPVRAVKAHGDPLEWAGVLLQHESGAHSELAVSGSVRVDSPRVGMEVFGPNPPVAVDAIAGFDREVYANIRRAFAEIARGPDPHRLDAAHGLYLQRIIAAAEAQL